jgi:hypothetical protein
LLEQWKKGPKAQERSKEKYPTCLFYKLIKIKRGRTKEKSLVPSVGKYSRPTLVTKYSHA